MEYNWGDPKKNSLLSSRMMAKAEVTRKKRLTSVKSTLSNQLHPAIEHKLRKKKKTPGSARRCSSQESSNNETEQKMEPQLVSDEELSTLDTVRHDAFPVPSYADYRSMFDEFDLNAAADGLFHPASTIEAFAEHDAKYRQEIHSSSAKPRSGPRRARSGSEYPPSRENHRLPNLDSGKSKRERRTNRPESKQLPAGNSGSAPASIRTISSLSKLLDVDEETRSLSATQSDSKLYAPRRLDVVPSSADRTALDFLEHELESDGDNNLPNSPVASFSREINKLDNNEIPEDSAVVPPLDFSLSKKFEKLKRIMKSNREKHNSVRDQPGNESTCNSQRDPPPPLPKSSQTKLSSESDRRSSSNTIRASSGRSATKTDGNTVKATSKKRSPAERTTTDMNNGRLGSKMVLASQGPASRKSSSSVAVVIPPSRLKKEHNGVSLSDLKAEHREALQMLKELGGPVDPDYLHVDNDLDVSKRSQAGRNSKIVRSSRSTMALGSRKSTNQLQNRPPASTPPTSANSTVSMVTKLRESISSGRNSRESSPRIHSPENAAVSRITTSQEEDARTGESYTASPVSNQTAAIVEKDDSGGVLDNSQPPLSTVKNSTEQYGNDGSEDNNALEHAGCMATKVTRVSGDRYSDEDFESD